MDQSSIEMEFLLSAPGKVLITGGYLIIDPANSGIVLALDNYFYCNASIRRTPLQEGQTTSKPNITVECPQMESGSNQMVESCLQCFEFLYKDHLFSPQQESLEIKLTLFGDVGFYSMREEMGTNYNYSSIAETHEKNKQIIKSGEFSQLPKVNLDHKTGLGSSAAMVVSLTSALFIVNQILSSKTTFSDAESFINSTLQDEEKLRRLHIDCQVVNAYF